MHCLEISFVTGVLVCLTGVGAEPKTADPCTRYESCHDILTKNPPVDKKDSSYEIYVGGQKKKVYCEMENNRGGWTVIGIRRWDRESFDRTWDEYKEGFGNDPEDYWIGNDAIHTLTKEKDQQLRVFILDGNSIYTARYSTFHVGDEDSKYKLTVSGYLGLAELAGLAGDGLKEHNGMMFTTKDKDYDKLECGNCAERQHGGWWYNSCGTSNLNAMFKPKKVSPTEDHIFWKSRKNIEIAMMMIKPQN